MEIHVTALLCICYINVVLLATFVLPRYAVVWVHVRAEHELEYVPPPSCPRLRRTISCLAPMLPSMASSSLAFMSLDFLKVRLFIRSNAFFPCMVNTTWALYPWGRTGWADGQRTEQEESYLHSTQQAGQVSHPNENVQAKKKQKANRLKFTGRNKRLQKAESPHSVARAY